MLSAFSTRLDPADSGMVD